jgi:ribokinase
MTPGVVVVGSFMMDHIVYVGRRPEPGETVRGLGFHVSEGGKGFNQAVAASRAGVTVRMLGRVGDDDLGRRFIQRARIERIDAEGIELDPDAGTGVGVPIVDETGENAIVVIPGANDLFTVEHLMNHADLVSGARVLLLQREIPEATAVRAAEIARAAGAYVVLNPAPAGPIDAFRGLVDLVVPNEGELAMLADGDDLVSRARALAADLDGCDVIVTLGSAGVLVVTGTDVTTFAAQTVEAVDTTGAGDCFCGNLAARLSVGDNLASAVEYAIVAAGIAVGRRGAADAAPAPDEVLPLLRERQRAEDAEEGRNDVALSTVRGR